MLSMKTPVGIKLITAMLNQSVMLRTLDVVSSILIVLLITKSNFQINSALRLKLIIAFKDVFMI